MFKFLDKNVDVLIKYSRYYLGLSFAMFLLIGGTDYEPFPQRFFISLSILFAYFLCYNFPGLFVRMQKKINRQNWEKVKKPLKFQLNFFIIIFSIGIILFLVSSIVNFEMFTLFAINLPLGIIIGSTKTKKAYLLDEKK